MFVISMIIDDVFSVEFLFGRTDLALVHFLAFLILNNLAEFLWQINLVGLD